MAAQDQESYGVDPGEFGSARVDAAALLDAELGDVDWSVPPVGSVAMRLPVPSGHLAALAMGDPTIRGLCWFRVPPARKRISR